MNWAVLRSFGFIVTFLATTAGLLVSQGVVIQGSSTATVVSWIITILGIVGGHQLAAKARDALGQGSDTQKA